jgi:type VI secretion system protein ImpK
MGKLQQSELVSEKEGLYQKVLEEINQFETKARTLNYDSESILVGCYILTACAKSILNQVHVDPVKPSTTEGSASQVLNHMITVLPENHSFSSVLDNVCQQPKKFLDVIELIYICLNLGFEIQLHENQDFQKMINAMYDIIRKQRGEVNQTLAISSKADVIKPTVVVNVEKKHFFFSFVEIPLIALVMIICMYFGMDYLFKLHSKQFTQQLQNVYEMLEPQKNV